ncbi:MAG: MXAN_2562 family outer membrane beta-barrel protein [Kofleriaceae bacterium]
MRLLVSGLIGLLCTTGVALADTDGTGSGVLSDGTTLYFNHLFLHENNTQANTQPLKDPDSLWSYFNYAHCECSIPGVATQSPYYEDKFSYLILLDSMSSTIHVPLEIWTGADCSSDALTRSMQCHQIAGAGATDIASISTVGTAPDVPIWELMNAAPLPAGTAPNCPQQVLSANEWAIASTATAGAPDFFVAQPINTDSLPPPLPASFNANGAESAIEISWAAPTGNVADIAYYQALCAKADGTAGRSDSSKPSPRYVTAHNLCGADEDIPLIASNIVVPVTGDGGVPMDAAIDAALDDGGTPNNLPDGLKHLDPAFLCGENATATATSMRLDHLTNGVPYTVVVLAIDKYGNAAGTYFTSTLTPQPVTDFWEDLHDKNDHIEGGFCLLAGTYGDDNPLTTTLRSFRDRTLAETAYGRWLIDVYYATLAPLGQYVQGHLFLRILSGILLLPVVLVALLWYWLTLPGLMILAGLLVFRRYLGRQRRLTTQVATVGALALVMFGSPARAHAQSPYWEDQTTGENMDAPLADVATDVKWHAGIRVGPYTPAIDSQSATRNSAGQGPYEAMYGGYQILPMLDVDRFLWTGFGELGVGLSIGYMGKTAHAYTMGSDPNSPTRERSPGDETSFKLVPLQLTATYRLTYLDDEYGIPIVPYVRGGLGYYIWWATAPDGSFSTDPMDANNRALGATAGLVGSVGIAVRAERIDAQAAQSMHESGLEHAGFYGEINAGWITGFGKDTKLDVGGTTWFAGVDFEF